MNRKQKMEILSCIVEKQESCASVLVEIGTTRDKMVDNNSIIIKDCPASVIEGLQKKFGDKLGLFMTNIGLEIELY